MKTKQEFLAERKIGLGGSDKAVIYRLSPWKTEVQLWEEKLSPPADDVPSERMILGTMLEPILADRYESVTGRKVQRFDTMLQTGHNIGHLDRLVCPDGKARASVARRVTTNRFLEIKTSSKPWEWEGEPPPYYLCQIHHYFGLCDRLEICDVPVEFISGKVTSFDIFSVERDEAKAKESMEFGNWWWEEYILSGKAPEPVNEEDCKILWRGNAQKGKIYTATTACVNAVRKLREIDAQISSLEAEASNVRMAIEAEMKDAEILEDIDGTQLLTWRQTAGRKSTAWAKVAQEAGVSQDLIDKYTKTGEPSRAFRLSTPKED